MQRQPTLHSLIAYVTVMRHGTVTEASRRLHIAQPALSRLIAKCEEALGVTLFVRERRRLVPTETAERLLPEVERLLASHAQLPDIAADFSWGSRSILRIAAAPRLTDGLVAEAIRRMILEDPSARFVVDGRERSEVERWIAANRYEIGVASMPIATESVDLAPLGEAESALILRKDDPLARSATVSLRALSDRRLILTAPGSLLRERTISTFAGAGQKAIPAIEVGTSALAVNYVIRGLGLFVADVFSRVGLSPELTTRPIEPSFSQRVSFVMPKGRPITAQGRRFTSLVREVAGEVHVRLL